MHSRYIYVKWNTYTTFNIQRLYCLFELSNVSASGSTNGRRGLRFLSFIISTIQFGIQFSSHTNVTDMTHFTLTVKSLIDATYHQCWVLKEECLSIVFEPSLEDAALFWILNIMLTFLLWWLTHLFKLHGTLLGAHQHTDCQYWRR